MKDPKTKKSQDSLINNNEQRDLIIYEVLSKDDSLNDSLLPLVKDKFGNYVTMKKKIQIPKIQKINFS